MTQAVQTKTPNVSRWKAKVEALEAKLAAQEQAFAKFQHESEFRRLADGKVVPTAIDDLWVVGGYQATGKPDPKKIQEFLDQMSKTKPHFFITQTSSSYPEQLAPSATPTPAPIPSQAPAPGAKSAAPPIPPNTKLTLADLQNADFVMNRPREVRERMKLGIKVS